MTIHPWGYTIDLTCPQQPKSSVYQISACRYDPDKKNTGGKLLDKRIEPSKPWKMRLIWTHHLWQISFQCIYDGIGQTCWSSKISLNSPRVRLYSDGTHGLKEFKCLLPSISFLATGHCCTVAKPVISLRARAVSNQHTAELVLYTYFSKHSKWSTSTGKIKHTRTRHVLGFILYTKYRYIYI